MTVLEWYCMMCRTLRISFHCRCCCCLMYMNVHVWYMRASRLTSNSQAVRTYLGSPSCICSHPVKPVPDRVFIPPSISGTLGLQVHVHVCVLVLTHQNIQRAAPFSHFFLTPYMLAVVLGIAPEVFFFTG